MIALDTNVLVRYLVDDEQAQSDIAKTLIGEALAAGEPVLLPVTTLVETVWVLRAVYKVGRSDLIGVLAALCDAPPFRVGDAQVVRRAIARWSAGDADFADYVIAEQAARDGCELVSFDGGLKGEPGVRVLRGEVRVAR